jgi:hypothetical protein
MTFDRRLAGRAAALVLVGAVSAGCGGDGGAVAPNRTAATVAGTKQTCPAPVVPTGSGFELVDRRLVGFGPTTLGVEEEYAGNGTTMRVVSGGYFDQITKAYDTLTLVGKAAVRGTDADVLSGPYQDSTVHIALWREPGLAIPCDAHAIVATGVTELEFVNMLLTLG